MSDKPSHKVFGFRRAWFVQEIPEALQTAEKHVLAHSPTFYINPRLAKPAWVEVQQDGIERICVDLEYDGLLAPPDVERNLRANLKK